MSARTAVGVIGCGFFARNHLHSWKDLAAQGADLVAVCDMDAAKAEAAAKALGVPRWYTDPRRMLDQEKLGLVDIITRMDTHRELVELAVAHRIPTIVQKPFAPDIATCEAMTKSAAAAGVFLAVHENFRYQRPIREAAKVLRSGAIGTPSWARISFHTGYDIYKGQPYLMQEERFILLDLGVHVLDVARVLLGEVEHLSAETQSRKRGIKGEDTATMLLRHRSGAVSIVECTYESRRLPDTFPETLVEIESDRGGLALRPGMMMEVTSDGTLTTTHVDAPVLPWAERPWHVVQESVFATCADILASLRAGTAAATSAADNLKTFALCEAAYQSAATGQAIKI